MRCSTSKFAFRFGRQCPLLAHCSRGTNRKSFRAGSGRPIGAASDRRTQLLDPLIPWDMPARRRQIRNLFCTSSMSSSA